MDLATSFLIIYFMILYLFITPFIIIGLVAYLVLGGKKK